MDTEDMELFVEILPSDEEMSLLKEKLCEDGFENFGQVQELLQSQ